MSTYEFDQKDLVDQIERRIRDLVEERWRQHAADYDKISHEDWRPGEVVINTRTGSIAVVHERKVPPYDNPFGGWWVLDIHGNPGGGIADFVTEWRSLKCLLAERRHLLGGTS